MNGVTTLYTVPNSFADNMNNCHEIENHHPISIPGIEGIRIPCGSHGYICKILEEDAALVHWEVNKIPSLYYHTSLYVYTLLCYTSFVTGASLIF
jgi:hypothetical protein